MATVAFLLLCMAHALPWLLLNREPLGKSAAKLTSSISAAMTLPYALVLIIDPSISDAYYLIYSDFEYFYVYFSVLYSIGLIICIFGIMSTSSIEMGSRQDFEEVVDNTVYIRMSILCYIISLLFIAIKFQMAGGLIYFISNIGNRAENLSGTGALDIIITPASYLAIFFAIYSNHKTQKPGPFAIVFIALTLFVLMAAFGGRKTPMMLIGLSILAYASLKVNIKIFSPVFLSIYALMAVFFVGMLQFRLKSQGYAGSGFDGIFGIIKNTSYIDTYLFIMYYFSHYGYWNGAAFFDLFERLRGAPYLGGVPPIDDGTYITSLMRGWNVYPPMAFDSLYKSSSPQETFGSGFMNFGPIGVLIFFYVKGVLSGLVQSIAHRYNFNPFFMFFLMYFSLWFHLTNLRIFQVITLVFGLFVFLGIFRAVSFISNRADSARIG